ncbi:MAG TPA: glycoside hydrolase family 16 protein [Solirubrobacterales bacterium]|nr:glycoside hydrolase family 16 protein [Solirubrobacterales bacterium]
MDRRVLLSLGPVVLSAAVAAAAVPAAAGGSDGPSGAGQPSAQRRGHGRLIFSDQFQGRPGDRPNRHKWVRMNWCDNWGSLSCNTGRRRNVALTGRGLLRITAIRQRWRDRDGNRGSWTSARLETQHKFSFRFGTVKARIRVPKGRGLWPAFWTNAATKRGWPATGEIDVMELLGDDPSIYYCSLHGASLSGRHLARTEWLRHGRSLARRFHVYAARWRPRGVTFFLDGERCGSIGTVGIQPIRSQQLLVGLAVGGDWPGPPNRSTPRRNDMLVDWVRVYAR